MQIKPDPEFPEAETPCPTPHVCVGNPASDQCAGVDGIKVGWGPHASHKEPFPLRTWQDLSLGKPPKDQGVTQARPLMLSGKSLTCEQAAGHRHS